MRARNFAKVRKVKISEVKRDCFSGTRLIQIQSNLCPSFFHSLSDDVYKTKMAVCWLGNVKGLERPRFECSFSFLSLGFAVDLLHVP